VEVGAAFSVHAQAVGRWIARRIASRAAACVFREFAPGSDNGEARAVSCINGVRSWFLGSCRQREHNPSLVIGARAPKAALPLAIDQIELSASRAEPGQAVAVGAILPRDVLLDI